MNKLAVIVTRGSYNSLVSVCTLIMAAAVSEISVRVFFRDEAVFSLTQSHTDDNFFYAWDCQFIFET